MLFRSRGDVGIAAAATLYEIGEPRELPMLEDAIGDAQAAHVGLLVRRHVEQAEEAPAEIIVRLGRLVGGGLRLELLVAVERIELALEFFRIRELAASLEHALLRAQSGGVGPDRLAGSPALRRRRSSRKTVRSARAFRDLQAGHEAFEIALLF